MKTDSVTAHIIGAAMAVHRALGPGLLESAYETCMAVELTKRKLRFARQWPISVRYENERIDCAYRLDLLVEKKVIVEIKAVSRLENVHAAQLLTYLKLSGLHVGLLINFNETLLKHGLRRIVWGPAEGK